MSDNREPQVAEALQEISTRVSLLVSDEIALAKAEVSQKVASIGRGAAAGAAAGAFLIFALVLGAHALAWGIYSLLGGHHIWLGYLLAMIIFVLLGALAGFLALRFFKKSSPPMPTMAIEEAQATKQAITDARKSA